MYNSKALQRVAGEPAVLKSGHARKPFFLMNTFYSNDRKLEKSLILL